MLVVLSVSEVNGYLRESLEADDLLRDLWVRGEISNLVVSQAGHAYFTLKDSQSQLRCVIFRGQLASIGVVPRNGLSVVAHGRLSVYEVSGQVQLYVDLVQPQGVGALYLKFERLRRQLEAEGLFDPARKRPLPRFPRRIGVVTSPTGAAVRDVVQVISRRYPGIELVVVPTLVQGDEAAAGIVSALAAVNALGSVDLVIVARGGGSIEDLWPFNEEAVARAIFASRVPVVTGVGHETDLTIADLVADLRAPTPSAAAEMSVPDRREYISQVENLGRRAESAVTGGLADHRYRLEVAERGLRRLLPPPQLAQWRQGIDDLSSRADSAAAHNLALWRERTRSRALQLSALGPEAVLARGFSVCWHVATARPVKRIDQVSADDELQIQVADGIFGASALSSVGRALEKQSAVDAL